MARPRVMRCVRCRAPARWGGRFLRVLLKHSSDSTCLFRDRWHCKGCCVVDHAEARRQELMAEAVLALFR